MFVRTLCVLRQNDSVLTHSTLPDDIVQEIASYLDMPTLRKMIDLSGEMKSTVGDTFALEFYRRGEKFVNWVNGLRITREIVDGRMTETTYIYENVIIVQSLRLYSGYSLSRIVMLDGVEMKSTRSWNAQGVMTLYVDRKNGQLHGLSENWNNQGVKTYSINYKDGEYHGLYEIWNDEGVKTFSYNYKDGQFHGLYEIWNDEGVKTFSYNYKDGQFHGLCESWDDQGVKTSSANYKDGQFHGLCESWDDQGVKTSSANYKDNLHGLCETWSEEVIIQLQEWTSPWSI